MIVLITAIRLNCYAISTVQIGDDKMTKSNDLEIYVQRYETFRHLDHMRYQAQNIAILIGTLFSAYVSGVKGDFHPILGLIIGIILVSLSFTMIRISQGIVGNSKVLKEFGDKVGDTKLPIASLGWTTATFWTTAVTFIIGLGLAVYSTCVFQLS